MKEETTSFVRGWGGAMFVVGVLACFTPLAPLGVVMAIVGAGMWLAAPANAERTQRMVDEAEEGGGCGSALAAVAFVVAAMGLAGVVAIVAGMALVAAGGS